MIYKIKLQIFFILLKLFNVITNLVLFHMFKRVLYKMVGFKVGKSVALHGGIRLFSFNLLEIGDNTTINFGCYLDNRRGIKIGNNVSIAHDVKIYTLGHDIHNPKFETKGSAVTIEDNVVIFTQALIMPGVQVGQGAIVFPGSVVTKNVEAFSCVGGNPAKFICKRNKKINYKIDYRYLFAN